MSENLENIEEGSVDPNQLELGLELENDPSYWNFRILKYEIEGETVYGIHEVQYNVDGKIVGYGEFPTEVFGNDVEQLKFGIDKIKEAFEKEVIELPIEE